MLDPDDRPLTFRAALCSAEYWLLLVAALAAGFGVTSLITVPTVMAGLLISSLPKYAPLYPRAKAVGAMRVFWLTVIVSILNATLAASAAHILGRLTWWLWGL